MGILYQHDFTGTAGTAVASLSPTIGSSGPLSTVVGGGQQTQGDTSYATSTLATSTCGQSVGGADYVLEATVLWRGSVTNGAVVLSGRRTDDNNRYSLLIRSNEVVLRKTVGGTLTVLHTLTRTLATNDSERLRLVMQGNAISYWIGNTLIFSTTDTSHTTEQGKMITWGGDSGSSATTGMHLDQFILSTDFPGATSLAAISSGYHQRMMR